MTVNKSPVQISCELLGSMQRPPVLKPTVRAEADSATASVRMSTVVSVKAQPKTGHIVSQSLVIVLVIVHALSVGLP